MPNATVNVKYVNQPGAGKKSGTIKTDQNVLYLVPPEKLTLFAPGSTYEIQYKESEFRGTIYKMVESAKAVASSAAPAATGGGGRYGATDDKTAERIFVCGAVNACLSNPGEAIKFYVDNPNHGVQLVNYWRGVWSRTFGGKPTAQDDMGGDEIPFA